MAIFLLLTFAVLKLCSGEDYKIIPINSSSGLYYEKIGHVLLSNNNWEFVTSVDYKGYLLFYQYLQDQAMKIQDFCKMYEDIGCRERLASIKTALSRLEDTDDTMTSFLGLKRKSKRVRRFWSAIGSFFGGLGQGIASALFGGSRQPDMSAYDQKIFELRSGQAEIMNKMNIQTTLFMADAEKKKLQIEWLQKTQSDISDKLLKLGNSVTEDSEKKAKQINELQSMLNETTKKLEEQGKIQKQLMENVNIIEDKVLSLNESLQILTNTVAAQGKAINETNLKVTLNSYTIEFLFLLNHFESEQNKLFYIIKRAKRGELDPYIITPLNLVEMLQNIMPHMPENEKFPFYPNVEHAHFLYNLIIPEVYFYNYTLLFILKMPLVNSKSFDFYKITSLPVPVAKNIFAFILPKDPLLIIDKNYHEYSTMPFQEYTTYCNEVNDTLYLCKQTQPLYSVYYDPSCEVSLLVTSKIITETCDKRMMYLKDIIFLQLQKAKSWIYSAPSSETPISVKCDTNHIELIQGSGFISLSENCQLRYKQIKIDSLLEYTKSVEGNYTSSQNLSSFISQSDIDHMQQEVEKFKINLILPFDLKKLADMSVPVVGINSSVNLYYLFLLLPISMIIILFGFLVYYKKIDIKTLSLIFHKRRNQTQNEPICTQMKNTEERGNMKIKIKVKKNNNETNRQAIGGNSGISDPDSEYLTLQVKLDNNTEKVKAFREPSYLDLIASPENFVAPPKPQFIDYPEDDVYGNGEVIKEEKYLNELRRVKPKFKE